MSNDTDEDYFLPLEDQRVFGAGIRRKRVQFVRASEHELTTTTTATPPPTTTTTTSTPPSTTPSSGPSIANKYLSIVLKNNPQPTETASAPPSPSPVPAPAPTPRCDVCNLLLINEGSSHLKPDTDTHTGVAKPHEASLAHQLCLAHSHPPSHLDRTRHGLRYLSAYGWDPDSRVGLGAPGREGIREPLKGRLKVDTVGLGAEVGREGKGKKGAAAAGTPTKVQKLNAKEVRKGHFDAKRRGQRLREIFYQNDDVQRYLSGGV
ncbi:putative G-patch domain protein [Aspergillus clavatus NRRL 1]|uniref:G-patch domain protein, putative n=1 Tax=Aspergillus clavatus (strain ATCC 1007 / CBS 513.65 / DSM 816 / NCTC 3887 / NRRL 1 / QM 1276 / 107) TaxID=344612 RepID=A1CB19_ASPCL|nr:G-patch domain protein, putative [Aspergillus clavatus NRRL 1]EAW12937.1 G-patch domain protein, putative [Aspergillus clavatus NRRL 1]